MKTRTVALSPEFISLRQSGNQLGEINDCAVNAVALAAGVSYTVAHAECARLGRKPGRGTAFDRITRVAIKSLSGHELELVDQRSITARYPGKHCCKTYITSLQPARFPKAWANDPNTYVCLNYDHVWIIDHGVNHDWSAGKSLRCKWLYRVVK